MPKGLQEGFDVSMKGFDHTYSADTAYICIRKPTMIRTSVAAYCFILKY